MRSSGGNGPARLATLGPDGPHVSPVWFTWVGGALWIYSLTRSQRWADLQRDPRVSAVIDGGHHYAELHGVEIEGEAVVVGPVPRTGEADPRTPELAEPERLMAEKYFGAGEMTHDGRHAWLRGSGRPRSPAGTSASSPRCPRADLIAEEVLTG